MGRGARVGVGGGEWKFLRLIYARPKSLASWLQSRGAKFSISGFIWEGGLAFVRQNAFDPFLALQELGS